MEIYEYKPGVQIDTGKCVVALGLFDGVHKAHRELLAKAREAAKSNGLIFAVFTFRAETAKLKGGIIYSTEQKLDILSSLGTEAVILADFDTVSGIEATDFIKNCLIGDMHCHIAAVGYDFRFGKGALGDTELLSAVMRENGKKIIIEEKQTWRDEKISSTKIKALIGEGNIEDANSLLSTPYFITATVTHGDGRGQKLGFPTVNTDFLAHSIIPRHGVYRTAVDIDGKLYSGITNVGVCPTFGERSAHAETFIIDFDGDLYEQKIRIFYLGFLRDEIKFSSENELIMQINVDKNRAIKENGDLTWQVIGQN